MWWTLFTAVDLYIGVIVLDAMAPSLAPEKRARLRTARKVILALLAISVIVLAAQVTRRYGWMKF